MDKEEVKAEFLNTEFNNNDNNNSNNNFSHYIEAKT